MRKRAVLLNDWPSVIFTPFVSGSNPLGRPGNLMPPLPCAKKRHIRSEMPRVCPVIPPSPPAPPQTHTYFCRTSSVGLPNESVLLSFFSAGGTIPMLGAVAGSEVRAGNGYPAKKITDKPNTRRVVASDELTSVRKICVCRQGPTMTCLFGPACRKC